MTLQTRNYDLIAIDLDGTLLDSDKNFSADALAAIQEAQDAGIRIIIVTGRNLNTLRRIFDQMHYADYFIGSGGAYIAHTQTREVLLMKTIRMQDIEQVILLGRKYPSILFVEHPNWMVGERISPHYQKLQKIQGYNWKMVDDMLAEIKEEPTKALFFGAKENLTAIKRELENSQCLLNISPSSDEALDITTAGTDKGKALLLLLTHIGIDPLRSAVLGDHFNDLEMFPVVKTAVAMNNAPEEIKKVADLVAPSNDDGGAAWAIRELLNP